MPTSDSGTATLGITVAPALRRNRKTTMVTSTTLRTSVISDVAHRGADGLGAVERELDLDGGRDRLGQARQRRLDAVDGLQDVRARLAADDHQHRALAVDPGGQAVVLDVVEDARDVAQAAPRSCRCTTITSWR